MLLEIQKETKKTLTLWPIFMDGAQLPQDYNHFEETLITLHKIGS